MPIVAGNTVRMTTFTQLGDQAGLVVWAYRCSASTGPGIECQEAANALDALFRPLFRALMSSQASYRGVRIDKTDPQTGIVIETDRDTNAPQDGLQTGDPLPRQVAGIITWRTLLAGRRNRGRSFIPFPVETANTSAYVPDGVYMAALAALGDERIDTQPIVGATGTATLVPTIMQRWPTPPITRHVDLDSYLLPGRWATQRRRGAYGRPNIPF